MSNLIQECSSVSEWQIVEIPSRSEEGVVYQVLLPPWNRDISEVICTCPSYRYRGKCRHQNEALSQTCSWNEVTGKKQTTKQKMNRICPVCGKKTNLIVGNNGDENE